MIAAETPGGGYAFVEDDQLDELTAALCSFLAVAGIAVNGTDPER